MTYKHPNSDTPTERLSGSVERVTFHSEEAGFCVLRIKVKGHLELVTVIGSAASITPGEYIERFGVWTNRMVGGWMLFDGVMGEEAGVDTGLYRLW
jgi:exodeoxyribonuclease V alpha subunit